MPANGALRGAVGEWQAVGRGSADEAQSSEAVGAKWYALWTRSHSERLVHDQLVAKGFRPFLPMIEAWSRRVGTRRRIPVPMFPGYLFLHHAMDKMSYVGVLEARGLVAILGQRWNDLAVVPEQEIEAIQRVIGSRLPVLPYPYLREGQRVRIAEGPLQDVEGILVRSKPNKGLLVLSVELVGRSVAVEIDCTLVAAA